VLKCGEQRNAALLRAREVVGHHVPLFAGQDVGGVTHLEKLTGGPPEFRSTHDIEKLTGVTREFTSHYDVNA
jgi:hypothetical protein